MKTYVHKMANKKKKKDCGHGNHFWNQYWSKKINGMKIKCIHCGKSGELNLEMN